jgi:HSP90 family molecular chaperone
MTTHSFETNIPELIRRLGINLYNDALVAARELIQNANDACILAEGLLGNPKGRIDVTVDERRGVITVQDNGIGMTAEDLQTLLSTIASSKKAQLRRELERKDFEAAGGIAGQFGIGFLSTFIIADKVEVFTRHQSERGPGSHWSSGGDGNYDLVTSSANLPKGTRIVLAVKPEFRRQLTTQAISAALNQHAPFIRTNYHINGSGLPVNHDPAPWDDPENAGLAEAYVSHAFSRRPLIGFYLQHDGPPVTPNGQLLRLRLRGYVAIPDERIYGERLACSSATFAMVSPTGQRSSLAG